MAATAEIETGRRVRHEVEPRLGHQLFVVAHGYQPPSEYFLPASNTRVFIRRGINERIYDSVYRRLLVEDGNVTHVAFMSLYGTQRDWIKRNRPQDFETIKSRVQKNPGSLLGDTGYHPILPLLDESDQETMVRIGRKGIKRDFGIEPRVIWIPEAAVSSATLTALHRNGYEGVILRDHQLKDTRKNPMYVKTGDGGEIAVIHVDRGLGEDVSFRFKEKFDCNGDNFLEEVKRSGRKIAAYATDMETYGGYDDPGKADFLRYISRPDVLRMHGFSALDIDEALDDPEHEYTEIWENSSWTCDHQLGRWTGAPDCNDDNPSPERQDEKRRIFGTLTFYGRQINARLDSIYPRWRDIYEDFSLDTEGFTSAQEWDSYMEKSGLGKTEFGRALQAKKAHDRGMTSCVNYYAPYHGVETTIAYSSFPEIEAAIPDIERADWRRGIQYEFPQTIAA